MHLGFLLFWRVPGTKQSSYGMLSAVNVFGPLWVFLRISWVLLSIEPRCRSDMTDGYRSLLSTHVESSCCRRPMITHYAYGTWKQVDAWKRVSILHLLLSSPSPSYFCYQSKHIPLSSNVLPGHPLRSLRLKASRIVFSMSLQQAGQIRCGKLMLSFQIP